MIKFPVFFVGGVYLKQINGYDYRSGFIDLPPPVQNTIK